MRIGPNSPRLLGVLGRHYDRTMDIQAAANRWADTWRRAWPSYDVEAIASLYAEDAVYRALAFREPDRGHTDVRRYLKENFEVEDEVECWFGEPVVFEDRATVEWWATWIENSERLTMAGATVLRFRGDGLVTDHRDYWNQVERREKPYPGW